MTDQKPCAECGHQHTPDGCTGEPTPSDRWAGVSPAACDCMTEPQTNLPPSYWIDQIRADLKSRRDAECCGPNCVTCPKETK